MRRFALLVMLGLGGCAAAVPAPNVVPDVSLEPVATGLRLMPDGRELGFGRDWAGVAQIMTQLRGAPDASRACGTQTLVTWGDLSLRHDGHRFVGLGCP